MLPASEGVGSAPAAGSDKPERNAPSMKKNTSRIVKRNTLPVKRAIDFTFISVKFIPKGENPIRPGDEQVSIPWPYLSTIHRFNFSTIKCTYSPYPLSSCISSSVAGIRLMAAPPPGARRSSISVLLSTRNFWIVKLMGLSFQCAVGPSA